MFSLQSLRSCIFECGIASEGESAALNLCLRVAGHGSACALGIGTGCHGSVSWGLRCGLFAPCRTAAIPEERNPMDFKPAKKLGFGLMRMPKLDPHDASKVDVEQVKQMVDLFMERGFTYFDTAWMYHSFASENVVKEVLTSRYPRESFTLATKLHNEFFDSLEGRDKVFNAQLEKTGAELRQMMSWLKK